MTRYRTGVDVGGTFTDFVMADVDAAGIDYQRALLEELIDELPRH